MRMTRDGSYAGIVGAISPTGQTYSFANDIFLWGVWDLFDPGFLPQYGPFADHADSWMPAFANVSGKYFLGTNVFPNTNEKMFTTICNTFHTHGDAFLRLFTEVPQEIVFEHDPFISCFSPFHITATPGAQIALTVVMDGQVHILATATATGQEQELVILEPITTGPIHLTMTGQNLLRHEENLWLVQLDRPFVVIDSLAMNGGGMTLDYDQTVNTSVVVVDVGLLPCDGGEVELTSESEHVTVTQAVASFGALQPNEPQLIENAPVFELGDDITDESIVPVTFTTHFGDESFSMTYDLRVLSPDITARLLDIDDDALGNGNGRLDPGEYATISFSVTNSGHLAALQPRFSLVNEEDYVMVLTPEQTLDDMEMGDTAELSFDVFVDHHAGEVPQVTLTLCSAIKGIRLRQNFYCTIGFVLESFERGLFDPEYWINDPEHPWFVVDDYAYDGNYSARSDTVTHNEASSLTLTHTAYEEGEFSFFCKVSSESNYDFLIFSIDSVEMDRWSGDVLWVEQTYDVQPGQHAYVWSYAKDYSVDGGLDAAWIDYIQLPFHPDAIEEQDDMPLTLHPNPTDGLIRIGLELAGDFTVQVFDEVGRLVLSRQNATAISLAGKPSGMYHVVVVQDGRRWSRKVVKF